MIGVKVCGITDPAALGAAAAAGADWVGFVFFPPSPRALTPAQAASLSATHPGGPRRVGLFVDPTEADIAAALAALPLDVLQINGRPGLAAAMQARFGVPAWAAIGVSGRADLPTHAPGIAGLLLDAKPPAGSPLPGGNAHSFDWSNLHGWAAPVPWMLAGGLTPANVASAVRLTGAPAVDVSSGVEASRGVKDPALIRAFIAAARAA